MIYFNFLILKKRIFLYIIIKMNEEFEDEE